MSVTFQAAIRLARPDHSREVCPTCKGRPSYAPADVGPEAARDCADCQGYGGDTDSVEEFEAREAQLTGMFNVANGNAAWIVSEVLGVPGSDLWGSMSGEAVLARLAMVTDYKAREGVRKPSRSRGTYMDANGVGPGALVIEAGRSSEQVERYLSNLKRCAELAQAAGVEVIWA